MSKFARRCAALMLAVVLLCMAVPAAFAAEGDTLPAGASVPFVHHHTQNEEVYLILEGKGMLYIDGEEVPLKEGDCFRIDPQGERCLRAADDSAMRFICIQAKAGSLEGFTMSDAVVTESGSKPSWL